MLLLTLHSLLSQSLFLQPSACPEAGPVSLSLFNLQLFWKGKFHEPVVFSCLLPSLHTYLPTSLHIDLPTHFSLFPCVVPNGPIHSSLVTVQFKEFPDTYTTGLSGTKLFLPMGVCQKLVRLGFSIQDQWECCSNTAVVSSGFCLHSKTGISGQFFCVLYIQKYAHTEYIQREAQPAQCGILLERAVNSFCRQGSSLLVWLRMPSDPGAFKCFSNFTSGFILPYSSSPFLLLGSFIEQVEVKNCSAIPPAKF